MKKRLVLQCGLRVKLMAPFVLAMVLLSIGLAWYTYSANRNAVENSMISISEVQTQATVSAITKILRYATSKVQRTVTSQEIISLFTPKNLSLDPKTQSAITQAHWESIIREMERMVQNNEFYSSILITNKQGICIASSNPRHIGISYARSTYIKEALEGKFSLGLSAIDRVTKDFRTPSAGPITVNGEIVGVVALFTTLPNLIEYEDNETHEQKMFCTSVLTSEGLFITHPDSSIEFSRKQLFPEIYKRLAQVGEKGGKISYTLNGIEYVGYAKLESKTKDLIITSADKALVYAPAYHQGFIVFATILILLVVVSTIAIKIANELLKVLLNLIVYAQQVSAGNLTLDIEESDRNDELGVLQNSLAKLVQTLRTMLKKTEATSKMKGRFLANMSHEIRTPLNAIIGLTYLATKDGKMDKKPKTYLDKVQLSAKYLLGLINDVLDISKVEAGMIELECLPFNLYDVISDCIAIHEETALGKGLTLTLIYSPNTEVRFNGDKLRIGQILNNLISNSLKFTQKGGITIFCAEEKVETPEGMVAIRISVKDSGIGMEQETLESLFKPFSQADASISRRFGGTGLGLAISKSLVELLGGTFEVQSNFGEGSTFSFTMLLERNLCSVSTDIEDGPLDTVFEQLNLQGKVILIAEDNLINQEIVSELISPSGATIILANNGQEAINIVSHEHVDIIFMDMQMPLVDGLEATRVIRSKFSKETLPIIALTANAMKADKESALECGVNGYLAKPIEPIQIIEVLCALLAKKDKREV